MDGTPTPDALSDHPLRYALANELHARPFPTMSAPCHAAYLAIKRPEDAARRDRAADVAHLTKLLDRHGAPHPQPGATHWSGQIGRHTLKWESHTEFVTYTLMGPGVAARPFDGSTFEDFPPGWLAEAPGQRITSALIRVEPYPDEDAIGRALEAWFVPESVAAARVLDDTAVVAGDFRIDAQGHMRFAVWTREGIGTQRVGRIIQRLCEIETYKSMSMLGLARTRALGADLARLDVELGHLIAECTGEMDDADRTLRALLASSAELEARLSASSFRFDATAAYAAIVEERIRALRETRFEGRQTFDEFMRRRYDPAIRTVTATQRRMEAMAHRATRAGNLLRTRVDVERSAQNRDLLASMDKRADMQLRLQRTVEGLSTVAISYYAVSLLGYALGPVAEELGVAPYVFIGVATPVVVLAVWLLVRRLRRKVE